jgi:hypothetical protein
MMSGEEGKLLAGAAGFYSPWGSERKKGPVVFCAATSFHEAEKKHFAPSAGTCIRLTPIRVREKRMNTLKTAKTRWSYQNVNK